MPARPPLPPAHRKVRLVIGFLILGAIFLALLGTRLPLVPRLLLASTDLVAALVLYTALRQQPK